MGIWNLNFTNIHMIFTFIHDFKQAFISFTDTERISQS